MLPKEGAEGWEASYVRQQRLEGKGVLTVVGSYDEGRVRAIFHVLKVLSVHLGPSGNGTSVWINLQPVGSVPPNPIPEKARARD